MSKAQTSLAKQSRLIHWTLLFFALFYENFMHENWHCWKKHKQVSLAPTTMPAWDWWVYILYCIVLYTSSMLSTFKSFQYCNEMLPCIAENRLNQNHLKIKIFIFMYLISSVGPWKCDWCYTVYPCGVKKIELHYTLWSCLQCIYRWRLKTFL